MTEEQFEDIKSRVNGLAEARSLSVEWQKSNFEVNYSKKLVKFFETCRSNEEYGIIDSICDMLIVAINSGHTLGLDEDFKWCEKYCNYSLDITMPLYDKHSLILLCKFLRDFSCNPYRCLLEKLKELESQTHSLDKFSGKWRKDLGAYTEEEAIENAWEEWNCGMIGNMFLFAEDENFWLVGDDDEYECEEGKTLDEIKKDYPSVSVKVKKWYKPNYSIIKERLQR